MKIPTEYIELEYNELAFELLERDALPYLRRGEGFTATIDGTKQYNACWRFAAKYGLRYDWDPVASTFTFYPVI